MIVVSTSGRTWRIKTGSPLKARFDALVQSQLIHVVIHQLHPR